MLFFSLIPNFKRNIINPAILPKPWLRLFFYALYKDDLGFAKELVIPDQRHRIDEWKIATKHKAIVCSPYQDPEHWIDPYAGGVGGGGFDGQKYKVDFDYFCYNGDQGELDIEDITVEQIGSEWVITDWGKICESSLSQPETCY